MKRSFIFGEESVPRKTFARLFACVIPYNFVQIRSKALEKKKKISNGNLRLKEKRKTNEFLKHNSS